MTPTDIAKLHQGYKNLPWITRHFSFPQKLRQALRKNLATRSEFVYPIYRTFFLLPQNVQVKYACLREFADTPITKLCILFWKRDLLDETEFNFIIQHETILTKMRLRDLLSGNALPTNLHLLKKHPATFTAAFAALETRGFPKELDLKYLLDHPNTQQLINFLDKYTTTFGTLHNLDFLSALHQCNILALSKALDTINLLNLPRTLLHKAIQFVTHKNLDPAAYLSLIKFAHENHQLSEESLNAILGCENLELALTTCQQLKPSQTPFIAVVKNPIRAQSIISELHVKPDILPKKFLEYAMQDGADLTIYKALLQRVAAYATVSDETIQMVCNCINPECALETIVLSEDALNSFSIKNYEMVLKNPLAIKAVFPIINSANFPSALEQRVWECIFDCKTQYEEYALLVMFAHCYNILDIAEISMIFACTTPHIAHTNLQKFLKLGGELAFIQKNFASFLKNCEDLQYILPFLSTWNMPVSNPAVLLAIQNNYNLPNLARAVYGLTSYITDDFRKYYAKLFTSPMPAEFAQALLILKREQMLIPEIADYISTVEQPLNSIKPLSLARDLLINYSFYLPMVQHHNPELIYQALQSWLSASNRYMLQVPMYLKKYYEFLLKSKDPISFSLCMQFLQAVFNDDMYHQLAQQANPTLVKLMQLLQDHKLNIPTNLIKFLAANVSIMFVEAFAKMPITQDNFDYLLSYQHILLHPHMAPVWQQAFKLTPNYVQNIFLICQKTTSDLDKVANILIFLKQTVFATQLPAGLGFTYAQALASPIPTAPLYEEIANTDKII